MVADADHSMLVMTEETFGPVLGVMPFDDKAKPCASPTTHATALPGFVFSRDLATALAIGEEIEAGSVWVNDIHRSNHNVPFGGMKESGIGREKGRYGVESYLEYKTLYLAYDASADMTAFCAPRIFRSGSRQNRGSTCAPTTNTR